MKKISISILFFFSILIQVYAQSSPTISTDRPGQYFAATTVPKGCVQLETGLSLDLLDGINNWGLTATDIRYGLTRNFELRTGVRANAVKTIGVDELAFTGALTAGLKWNIVNKKVQLAYLAEAIIPNYPEIINAYHLFIFTHPVGRIVNFNYMLLHSYDFSQVQSPNYGGMAQFSYAVSFALMKKWSIFLEFSGMWDSGNPNTYRVLYDAGLAYLIKNNLQIDIYFGHGINYKHGTYGLGISWLPRKIKKPTKKIITPTF